jgi:hypothetical protein
MLRPGARQEPGESGLIGSRLPQLGLATGTCEVKILGLWVFSQEVPAGWSPVCSFFGWARTREGQTGCSRLWECGVVLAGVVLAGVKAKPCGRPTASLDPSSGRHRHRQLPGAGPRGCKIKRVGGGIYVGGVCGGGVERSGGRSRPSFFLILLRKRLVIEHRFEYNGFYGTRGPQHG